MITIHFKLKSRESNKLSCCQVLWHMRRQTTRHHQRRSFVTQHRETVGRGAECAHTFQFLVNPKKTVKKQFFFDFL